VDATGRGRTGIVQAALAAAALGALAAAGPARAEGEGFKIGEAGRLHLFLDFVGGYDSNALYNLGGSPIGSGVLDLIGGFKLDVAVPIRPGGGALTITPSGQWILQSFEPYGPTGPACDPLVNPTCTNQDIGAYGYNQLAAALQAKWAFLPKTAVLVEGSWFKRYPNDGSVSYGVQGWKAWGGAAGLVTSHLAATLKAGYGGVFDTPQVTGGTWLLNAEVQYVTDGVIDARLGYLHDFAADIGLAYSLYYFDRVYLDLKWHVQRFVVKVVGSWDWVHYVLNDVTGPILQVTPGLDYELARWAYLGATYTYTYRSSNETSVPAFNYTRNQVYGYLKLVW